jgi:hypothetical protein
LHAGQIASVFASFIGRNNSNLDLHLGQKYSYMGISYLSKKILVFNFANVKKSGVVPKIRVLNWELTASILSGRVGHANDMALDRW